MDYDRLLNELADLGAERIADPDGDWIHVPTGFGVAICVHPNCAPWEHWVTITTWDQTGASSDHDVAGVDDPDLAVAAVRWACNKVAADGAAKDYAMGVAVEQLAAAEPEIVIPAGATRVGVATMKNGAFGVDWTS